MLRDGGDVNGFWTMINDFARSALDHNIFTSIGLKIAPTGLVR